MVTLMVNPQKPWLMHRSYPFSGLLMRVFLGMTLFILLIPAAQASDAAEKPEADGILYKITHPEQAKPSYLFGTMHLMKSGYLAKWPRVQEAFQAADRVMVETVIDSSKLMEIGQMAMMRSTTYGKLYDSATLDTLNRYLKAKLPMPTATLKRMKPIQLSILTAQQAYQQVNSPLKSADGISVDQHFAAQGEKQGKTILTLETMMEQAEMLFNGLSIDKQAEMLIKQVRKGDEVSSFTRKLLDRYKNRNLAGLHELYEQEDFATQNMGFLVEERNKDWITDLKKPLKKGNTFTAVGALHLPGEEGLLNLLKQEGFEVQPLSVK